MHPGKPLLMPVIGLSLFLAGPLAGACSSDDSAGPPALDPTPTAGDAGTSTGGGSPAPSTGGGGLGGAPPVTGQGGVGLYSDVFESWAGAAGAPGEVVEPCPESEPGVCDWSRVTGCCRQWACEGANGADVWNTHPIEACQLLVQCVQDNAGCSTIEDPLCFGDEDPNAPCLSEGYNASHNEPDGPFAWTVELVSCVCNY